jgi:hypothetical protein
MKPEHLFPVSDIRSSLGKPRPQSRGRSSGQAFFKWLALVALLAVAGLGYCLVTAKQAHQAELARVQAEHQQQSVKQAEELEQLRNESQQVERLRAESQEVVKLRGEVAQLRTLQKEQQKIQLENQQLRSNVQQLQQAGGELSTLRNQNQQLQGALADRAGAAACLANLKLIEGLKTRWASDMQKRPTDTPLDSDLFGPAKYLPQKPACPAGGVYTLGPVQTKPTCSTPGHAY